MAQDLGLELSDGSNTYTFDVDGEFLPTYRNQFKTTANPPELTRVVETWEFKGCKITGNSVETVWDNYTAFLGHVLDRTGDPLTSAKVIRAPAGAAVTERTLGPSTHQEFRTEIFVCGTPAETEPELRAGQWVSVISLNITFTAVRVFADGNGIVEWDQRLRFSSDESGLAEVTLTTTLSTAEAASAVTAVETYGLLAIATYGGSYAWATNSDTGVDYEVLDSDVTNARVPTRVIGVSKLRQWGVFLGVSTPGNAVGDVFYETETITEGDRIEINTRARARGNGALAWVNSRAPTGPHARRRILDRTSHRAAEAEWRKVFQADQTDPSGTSRKVRWAIEMVISGGDRPVGFASITGALSPAQVIGTFQRWQLDIAIKAKFVGLEPRRKDIPFPTLASLITDGWVMVPQETKEDAIAKLATPGTAPEFDEWERSATVVLRSARQNPSITPIETFGAGIEVPSYRLTA